MATVRLDEGVNGDDPFALTETHSAVVFFVGDRAYKLKKSVDLGFLDFRDRTAREMACHREVALNRRIAPDVYLGVADVTGPDGEPCDHFVVMRRLPAARRLSTLLAGGHDLRAEIDQIAHVVAAFHEGADPMPDAERVGSADAVMARWDDNTDRLRRFAGSLLDGADIERIASAAHRYLAGRRPLFARRIANGRVRDCHGDLLAGDIFCLDDGPRILDCLDFDDELRCGDVLLDAAFLTMDVERLGRPDLAARFLHRWAELTGETHPSSLAHHYIAYRAQVRAAVSCIRCEQGADEAVLARQLLALCSQHLAESRVRLVLVGGLPGTGKSTLAKALGARLGWPVLRSDEVRKELAGLEPGERRHEGFDVGLYDPIHTGRTYRELLRRAHHLLGMGESVILDASWTSAVLRAEAATAAQSAVADLVSIRCVVDSATAARRMRRRAAEGNDLSDADDAVARAMARVADPWPESTAVDTDCVPEQAVEAALTVISAVRAE